MSLLTAIETLCNNNSKYKIWHHFRFYLVMRSLVAYVMFDFGHFYYYLGISYIKTMWTLKF